MKNRISILFWKIVKWRIKKDYGADCAVSDLDEFPKDYQKPSDVFKQSRCASCKAKEMLDWIDGHIELLEL